MLEVVGPLEDLLPEKGLRPGAVVAVGGTSGSTSLLLGLLAGPLSAGSWGAVVGMPDLGLEAAAGLGVNLEHLALVPRWGSAWLEVVATLLGGFEMVVLRPPGGCRGSDARRLAARARQAGTVLLLAAPSRAWPEPVDIELVVTAAAWRGLEVGHGALGGRMLEVSSSGRRAAGRERRVQLWLPAPGGGLACLAPVGVTGVTGVTGVAGMTGVAGVADVAGVELGRQTVEDLPSYTRQILHSSAVG